MGRPRKDKGDIVKSLTVSLKSRDIDKLSKLHDTTPQKAARKVLENHIKENDDSC